MALEIANDVLDTVRSYVQNLQNLRQGTQAAAGRPGDLASTMSSSGESVQKASRHHFIYWLLLLLLDSLSSVPSEDLGLLAKTLQQRGDIQKAMAADLQVYLGSYREVSTCKGYTPSRRTI